MRLVGGTFNTLTFLTTDTTPAICQSICGITRLGLIIGRLSPGTSVWGSSRAAKASFMALPLLGSPRTFGGWGVGSTSFWVDPQRELTFTLLAAGVTPDHRFVERSRRLGDAVIAALL
jgi:CubicO group peptidase (beta-lactamase class C family)